MPMEIRNKLICLAQIHRHCRNTHQRHRLPCWGARRGINLEAMAEVSPAGGCG
jgi:hypothetical protein